VKVLVIQACPTFCNPMDCSPPGSFVYGILQERILKNSEVKWSEVKFSRSVVSNSLQTHGLQHARPPCPSPTPGVYPYSCPLSWWCHPTISSSAIPFSSCLQSFLLQIFPTPVGIHSLLQGIFPTQRLNLDLLHCRQILYHLSHQGRPKVYLSSIPFANIFSQSISCLF